jgi:hypothetical protein
MSSSGAGCFVQLAPFCRLGDRCIDPDDRRMDRAIDHAEKLA